MHMHMYVRTNTPLADDAAASADTANATVGVTCVWPFLPNEAVPTGRRHVS